MSNQMTIDPEMALSRARNYGRQFHRGRMIQINRVDDERCRALDRLIKSRRQIVRQMAIRIMALDNAYRYYRYLNTAPMSEIEALAQHPTVTSRRSGGGAA
jgi:hypothetical protein